MADPAGSTDLDIRRAAAELLEAHGRTVTVRQAGRGGRVDLLERCEQCDHPVPWGRAERAVAVAQHQVDALASAGLLATPR